MEAYGSERKSLWWLSKSLPSGLMAMFLSVLGAMLLGAHVMAVEPGAQKTEEREVLENEETPLERILTLLLRNREKLDDLRFRTVIQAATGHGVLPMQLDKDPDARIYAAVEEGMDDVMEELNQADSPTNEEGRINEVSGHFERALRGALDEREDFACQVPVNAEGEEQRSGYPDLRLVHKPSGRVAYIDPKLVAEGSLDNGFRTFYYSPKGRTNKVLDDAHHLLIGIEHDRNTGNWTFLKWHLVDLHDFRVNLKAEFQASNKDLYRPELTVKPQNEDHEEMEDGS